MSSRFRSGSCRRRRASSARFATCFTLCCTRHAVRSSRVSVGGGFGLTGSWTGVSRGGRFCTGYAGGRLGRCTIAGTCRGGSFRTCGYGFRRTMTRCATRYGLSSLGGGISYSGVSGRARSSVSRCNGRRKTGCASSTGCFRTGVARFRRCSVPSTGTNGLWRLLSLG